MSMYKFSKKKILLLVSHKNDNSFQSAHKERDCKKLQFCFKVQVLLHYSKTTNKLYHKHDSIQNWPRKFPTLHSFSLKLPKNTTHIHKMSQKSGIKSLTLKELLPFFEKPLSEAATMLGRSSSKLKQELRALNIRTQQIYFYIGQFLLTFVICYANSALAIQVISLLLLLLLLLTYMSYLMTVVVA